MVVSVGYVVPLPALPLVAPWPADSTTSRLCARLGHGIGQGYDAAIALSTPMGLADMKSIRKLFKLLLSKAADEPERFRQAGSDLLALSQSGSTASDHEPAEPTQGSCDGIQISAGLDSAESRGD